jgi:PilZ domain
MMDEIRYCEMNPRPNWFARLFVKDRRDLFQDRRDAERHRTPQLQAYYWTGAAPAPHSVRDISSAGAYLVTEERWHPGTVLMLTLQRMDKYIRGRPRSITLQSKVVRWGIDGVGFAFVFPATTDFREWDAYVHGADRKMFDSFVWWDRPNNQKRTM